MSDNFNPINNYNQNQRNYPERQQSNGLGLAGFILAICAIVLSWAPFLNFIIWLLGLIFSLIGVFRNPKGFAIAGLVISLIGIILILVLLGSLAALVGLNSIR